MASARGPIRKREYNMAFYGNSKQSYFKKQKHVYPQKPSVYKKWALSGGVDVRVGIVNSQVKLRISSQYDLDEERPGMTTEQQTEGKKEKSISQTVFLNKNEVICMHNVLQNLFHCWDYVEEGAIEFGKLTCMLDEDKVRRIYEYVPDTSSEISIAPSEGKCFITTFKHVEGIAKDRGIVQSARVVLTYEGFKELCRISSEIITHVRDVFVAISEISPLIVKEAGKTLSKMLVCEHGQFSSQDIISKEPGLMSDFLSVYSEFQAYGYSVNLTKAVRELIKKSPHITRPRIDLLSLVISVVGQIEIIYDASYIKV